MMNKEKKLVKNILIFGIGNIGSKLINFIMLPYYTILLSTQDYGEIDIIISLVGILTPLVSLNIFESVFRFTLDKKSNLKEVLNNSLLIVITMFFLFTPLGLFFIEKNIYFILFSALLFTTIVQTIFKQFVRGINKLDIFIYSDFIQVISFILLNILFLGYLKLNVVGFLLAKLISIFFDLMLLFLGAKIYNFLSFKSFRGYCIKNLLKYGLPLIPNSLMVWIMNMADRFIIIYFLGMSANGLYSVANKFPALLFQVNSIFFNAWQISSIQEYDSEGYENYYSKIFSIFYTLLMLLTSSLLLVIKPLVSLLVSDTFFISWRYIPFLFLGAVFSSLASFLGTTYMVHKNTSGFIKTSIIGAIINILLNLILVPKIGIQAAAFTTMISYFFVFIIRYIDCKKKIKLKINFFETSLTFIIIIFQISILLMFNTNYNIIQLSLYVSLIFVNRRYITILINKILENYSRTIYE